MASKKRMAIHESFIVAADPIGIVTRQSHQCRVPSDTIRLLLPARMGLDDCGCWIQRFDSFSFRLPGWCMFTAAACIVHHSSFIIHHSCPIVSTSSASARWTRSPIRVWPGGTTEQLDLHGDSWVLRGVPLLRHRGKGKGRLVPPHGPHGTATAYRGLERLITPLPHDIDIDLSSFFFSTHQAELKGMFFRWSQTWWHCMLSAFCFLLSVWSVSGMSAVDSFCSRIVLVLCDASHWYSFSFSSGGSTPGRSVAELSHIELI